MNVIASKDRCGASSISYALTIFKAQRCHFLVAFVKPIPAKPPAVVLITPQTTPGDFLLTFVLLLLQVVGYCCLNLQHIHL